MNRDRIAAYAQVMILALAASVIYSAPYLRQLFKTSLLEAFSLTEAQLGNLSSTYALACLVCYVPGGWLADRVEARKLVIIALFASAGSYAWFATIPSYEELLVIYAAWGVIGVGILWAAMFKQVRLLGSGEEQGRLFGALEGTRGLFEAILLTVGTFIFGLFATRQLGMINVIILYTVSSAALGVILMFWKSTPSASADIKTDKIRWADLLIIVRQPSIWLLCIILSALYHVFWATIEFPSFAETGGFEMTLAAATALGAAKLWMRFPGGILAGMVGDRVGNPLLMVWLFLLSMLACFTSHSCPPRRAGRGPCGSLFSPSRYWRMVCAVSFGRSYTIAPCPRGCWVPPLVLCRSSVTAPMLMCRRWRLGYIPITTPEPPTKVFSLMLPPLRASGCSLHGYCIE